MKRRPKLRKDVNEIAFGILQAVTGEGPRPQPPGSGNPEAKKRGAAGGKKGGKKGGPARANKLSDEEKAKTATVAALARWKKSP